MHFSDLGLIEPIVRAVDAAGYSTPTPIQQQAIPVALEGNDILGCAQTGTGKTCAFALPILDQLADGPGNGKRKKSAHGRPPRALVLCPTRELAMQIYDSFMTYGKFLPLRHTVVFGGVSQHRQVQAMRSGVDVLIATPGRLLDLINQGHIDLSAVETLVLDEADRMLDMGFIPDIRKVVKMIREDRQTLLFSATMSSEIRKLADSILTNPVSIETVRESTTAEAITQRVYLVEKNNKAQILEQILTQDQTGRSLVFTRTN
ncbi:MAG: DEAD/DEAH box helicase [Phycisphaerales bacterium JB050]